MTGRNKVNAINMKKIPAAMRKPKYTRDFPEGILLVADWKFPGKSLTPLETTLNVPETVSLADLTADSRSNAPPKELAVVLSSDAFVDAYEFQSASSDDDDEANDVCCSFRSSSAMPAENQFCILLPY